jgi:MFS superfamily sulfate permease-like transporter
MASTVVGDHRDLRSEVAGGATFGGLSASKVATSGHEKPRNGWAGLKEWRYDLRSGFMVAMISLPFSMGIAITSGAPPVCGIVSAIIAGFLLPFLGGSYVTVSGPAAGLAPALYAGMVALGKGDLGIGYPRVLAAICIAGVIQFILARFKIARLSAIFPAAAIEGMLAAIGLMIIVKQVPLLLGQPFEAHEFWEILAEVPEKLSTLNPQVLGLGVVSIALIFALAAIPSRLLKVMPPPVWAFVLGTFAATLFLDIRGNDLIHVPEAPLANGIVSPDFSGVFSDNSLWFPLVALILTLVLIDGTESLATIAAVDKLDPFRRKSDPDRTLLAMGASNVASSMLGGLTIIPGIVKSTANILGGGRTQWANFYNACFLLVFLVFCGDLVNMVPKCVLAAILVFVGFKLCRPKVWTHMAKIGKEQFAIFATTVLVTVSTDLLVGIIAGVAMKFALCAWYNLRAKAESPADKPGLLARTAELVRNPVGSRQYANGAYDMIIERPLVCFNLFHLIREMDRIPSDAKTVNMRITTRVTMVDHTTCENLLHYAEEFNSHEDRPTLAIEGLERMNPTSADKTSIRLASHRPSAVVSSV